MTTDRITRPVTRALAVLALLAVACAPGPRAASSRLGDAHFERGAYAAAITSYERDLRALPRGAARGRILYRLALSHLALPDPGHRARARALLAAVARAQPETPLGRQAAVLAAHLAEVARAERRIRRQERQVGRLRLVLQRLRDVATAAAARSVAQADQVQQLTEERERLRAELEQAQATSAEQRGRIQRLTDEIDRLTQQLDALKDIDLERRP